MLLGAAASVGRGGGVSHPQEKIVFQKRGLLAMDEHSLANFANLSENKGLYAHFVGK